MYKQTHVHMYVRQLYTTDRLQHQREVLSLTSLHIGAKAAQKQKLHELNINKLSIYCSFMPLFTR